MSFFRSVGRLAAPSIGMALGGPAGAAIGGAAFNMIAGDGKKQDADPNAGMRSRLLQLFGQDAAAPLNQSATFQAGSQEIRSALGLQADADAATAAASGLQGGEADIARAAGRSRALTSGLTGLLGQAQQQQQHARVGLAGMLGQDQALAQRQREGNESNMRQAMGSLAQALPTILNRQSPPTKPLN